MAFPISGSDLIQTHPVCSPTPDPVPEVFYPSMEAPIKYQLWSYLNDTGKCYCEASLAGRDQIDLVWLEPDGEGGVNRTVGIEVKTASEFNRATHKLEKQFERYHTYSVADLSSASYVCGNTVTPAESTYLFDQLWVVVPDDQDRLSFPWRDDTPEDAWLNYDKYSGIIECEIDSPEERETAQINWAERTTEAQLTATLWKRYNQGRKSIVGAESWFSKPTDRVLKGNRIKYRDGQRGHADLVLAKRDELNPITKDTTIRALEVKTSLDANTKNRLHEQLDLYCNSKMFSEIYLAVPVSLREDAHSFLTEEWPQVGLLSIDLDTSETTAVKTADKIELEKIPMVESMPGKRQYFEFQ